MGKWPAGT
ncbi:xylose isomerase-like TIM barrel family protein, partial [Yersinia pestis PY-92]